MSSGAVLQPSSPYKQNNLVRSDGFNLTKMFGGSRSSSANSTPARAPSRQGSGTSKSSKMSKSSKSSKSNKSPTSSASSSRPSSSIHQQPSSSSSSPSSSPSVQVETSSEVVHDSPNSIQIITDPSPKSPKQKKKLSKNPFKKSRSNSLHPSTAPKAKQPLSKQRSVDPSNLTNSKHETNEMRDNSKQISEDETGRNRSNRSKSLIPSNTIKTVVTSNQQPSSQLNMVEQTNHVTTNHIIIRNVEDITEAQENTQQIADVESSEHKILLYSLDLNKSEDRLKTLKWWPLASPTRQQLATNGFFYLGNQDRTQCYYCKIVIRDWNENADVSQHHYDNCTMKQEQEETNRQATTTTQIVQQPETEDTEIPTITIQQSSENITHQASTSRIQQASSENIAMPSTSTQQAERTIQQASTESSATKRAPTRTVISQQAAQVSQEDDEEEESENFNNNVVTATVTSSSSRMMQCHDDTDDEEEVVIDEDIEITPNEDPIVAEMNRDIYPCENPAVPTMKKLDARVASFHHESWDGDEMYFLSLAESGLFYLGSSDIVRCWYCGVHLTNWYWNGVDSWKCHVSSNLSCEYLKRNRSAGFIEEAVMNPEPTPAQIKREEEELEEALREDTSSNTQIEAHVPLVFSRSAPLPEYVPDTRPKDVQDREELERAMGKEPALTAISMGYTREKIEQVLKKQISENGVAYQTYDGLIAAVTEHH